MIENNPLDIRRIDIESTNMESNLSTTNENDTESGEIDSYLSTDLVNIEQAAKKIRYVLGNLISGLIHYNTKIIIIIKALSIYGFLTSIYFTHINSTFIRKINDEQFDHLVNYTKIVKCRQNMTFDEDCELIIKHCAVDSYDFILSLRFILTLNIWNIMFWLGMIIIGVISSIFLSSIHHHVQNSKIKVNNCFWLNDFFPFYSIIWLSGYIILLLGYAFSIKSIKITKTICEPTEFARGYPGSLFQLISIALYVCVGLGYYTWVDTYHLAHIATLYNKPDKELLDLNENDFIDYV
jgi:hypothetical protein